MPAEARAAVDEIRHADIVVGIPSYNNSKTIGHVVQAAHAGLTKYFPGYNSIIVNSDGGSKDGTPDVVTRTNLPDAQLLMLSTPLKPVHRLSFPYHGIPGKGSAFRMIFQMAALLDAKACVVVDSDLRSITPEWFDLLIRPVIGGGFDFVAPYYHRHKYDGTITNSIVYPLTRCLYSQRLRQPIGGDFGVSRALFNRYLERDDWETDVARFGIDIWMTTHALVGGFAVCETRLGAKVHDPKDPSADLAPMFRQVVGTILALAGRHAESWLDIRGSHEVPAYGFERWVEPTTLQVNTLRLLAEFETGRLNLGQTWRAMLAPDHAAAVEELAVEAGRLAERAARRLGLGGTESSSDGVPTEVMGDAVAAFHFPDELWAGIVYDLVVAARFGDLALERVVAALVPLYFGRVGSLVVEARHLAQDGAEERVERQARVFELRKPYLVDRWRAALEIAGSADREGEQG